MKNSMKKQLRMLKKINTDYSRAEPEVIGRRPLHESLARLCVAWTPVCHVLFIVLGFVFIALPSFNGKWLSIVSNINFLRCLYEQFSSVGFVTLSCYAILFLGIIYPLSKIDGAETSNRGYPINIRAVDSFRQVIDAELYPIAREEELVFFVEIGMSFFMASVWWMLVFGLLSYAIK